jgi:hypothetical protein
MTEWNGGAGPRIVAIGGGTGLSTMLRGLKSRTRSLTAIVTVADDGGGSGMLRQDLGMPPPGDIRHCMEALANAEPVMQQLLRQPDGAVLRQPDSGRPQRHLRLLRPGGGPHERGAGHQRPGAACDQ